MTGVRKGIVGLWKKPVAVLLLALFFATASLTTGFIPATSVSAAGTGVIKAKLLVCQPDNGISSGKPIDIANLTSIDLKNNTTGADLVDTSHSGSFYSVNSGLLTINSLDAGDYSLSLAYNNGVADYTFAQDSLAVSDTQSTWAGDQAGTCLSGGGVATKTPAASQTCQGGAMGWIICPIASSIQTATDAFYSKIIIPFLTTSPLTYNTGDPVYVVWNNIRNIANITFVIAFMAIIYSQATTLGISSYGVKKLLPRIILVAILTNISYFICAGLIDVFNILGSGLANLMLASLPANGNTTIYVSNGSGIGVLAAGAVGLTALIASSGGLLPAFFILIAAAFAVILLAVIVLVVRQIAIITLVVIAPLAFVAWLLPNTEKQFYRWLSTLAKLLLMYPMLIAIFVGSKIFSAIITQQAFIQDEAIKGAIGFLVQAVPLLALPFTFAIAGGAFSKIAGAVFMHGNRLSKQAGSEGYKRTSLGRMHELKKQAKDGARQRRVLDQAAKGRGIGGLYSRGQARLPAITETQKASKAAFTEQLYAAKKKIDAEKVENIGRQLTRNSSMALAEGWSYNSTKKALVDRSGTSVSSLVLSTDQQDLADGFTPEDITAMNYAHSNNVRGTLNGAQAVGEYLHTVNEMSQPYNSALVGWGNDGEERTKINSALNSAAISKGNFHFGYNIANPTTGAVQFAGQKGPTPAQGLASIISSKGINAIPKEAYTTYSPADVQSALYSLYSNPNAKTALLQGILSITEPKRQELVKDALNRAGVTTTVLNTELADTFDKFGKA